MIRIIQLRDIYNKAIHNRIAETQSKYHETLEKALIEAAEHGCNAIQITQRKAKDNQWDKEFFVRNGFTIMNVGDTWIITFKSVEDGLRVWGGKL